MAERAHPDDPAFKNQWDFRFRRGVIPWLTFQANPFRKEFFWRYHWISQHSSGKDVLDIPCGMGWGTSLIRGTRSLTGIDLSEEAIIEARQRYGHRATFRTGDMAHLDLPTASMDVISCLEGIEHVPVQTALTFLAESSRILRPKGLLLLSSPYCKAGTHSGNPFHLHEYRPEEIRAAVSGEFKVEELVTRDVDAMTVLYLQCRRRGE